MPSLNRRLRLPHLLLLLVVAFAPLALPSDANAKTTDGRVLVIACPRLSFADLNDPSLTGFQSVLGRSALASLSVRTIGPLTSPAEAYGSLSAGNRVAVRGLVDDFVLNGDENFAATKAETFFRQRVRTKQHGDAFAVGISSILYDNEQLAYGGKFGLLADTLFDHKLSIGVIGNADTIAPNGDTEYRRAIGLLGTDSRGVMRHGEMSQAINKPGGGVGGFSQDLSAVQTRFQEQWASRAVVAVECSDLERVESERSFMASNDYKAFHRDAVKKADRLVAMLTKDFDYKHDTVLLVSGVAPQGDTSLTVFAAAGPKFSPGWAESPTTRRKGFVTINDVTPTILDQFGIKTPSDMTGTVIDTVHSASRLQERLNALERRNDISVKRNKMITPLSVAFIVVQVVGYILTALALSSKRPRLRDAAGIIGIGTITMPLVLFLSGFFRYDKMLVYAYLAFAILLSLVIGAVLVWSRKWKLTHIALVLIGLNWLLQIVDIATGGKLQLDTIFGYSPIIAGRFQGFGNLAFAIVAISALLVAAAIYAGYVLGNVSETKRHAIAIVLLVLTILFDGLPMFGSDVGGVLASVPAFGVTVFLLRKSRVNWKRIAVLALGALGLLAIMAAIDLSRPAADRTHLGRFVASLTDGHAGDVITRKVQANLSILTSSVFTWVIPIAILFLIYLSRKPTGYLHSVQVRHNWFRAALVGGFTLMALTPKANTSRPILWHLVLHSWYEPFNFVAIKQG